MRLEQLQEQPLFPDEKTSGEPEEQLSIQKLKEKYDIANKKKTLEFCLASAKWIAPIAFALIVGDVAIQYFGLDSTLLKDCFSLLTYVVTAALGFVFANNSK